MPTPVVRIGATLCGYDHAGLALAKDLNGKKARIAAAQPKWIFQDIKSGEPWAIPVANELARFNPLDLLKAPPGGPSAP